MLLLFIKDVFYFLCFSIFFVYKILTDLGKGFGKEMRRDLFQKPIWLRAKTARRQKKISAWFYVLIVLDFKWRTTYSYVEYNGQFKSFESRVHLHSMCIYAHNDDLK